MSGGVYSPWGESPVSAPRDGISSDPVVGAAPDPEIPGLAAHGREAGTTSAAGGVRPETRPARDGGGLRAAGVVLPSANEPDPRAIVLDDFVAAILAIVAAHDQLDPGAWVARAICHAADEIGLGFILDEMMVKAAETDGDLRHVPDFQPVAGNRFAKPDDSAVSSDGGER